MKPGKWSALSSGEFVWEECGVQGWSSTSMQPSSPCGRGEDISIIFDPMSAKACPFIDSHCLSLGRTDSCCHWIQKTADAEPCLVSGVFISDNWHTLGVNGDADLKMHVNAAHRQSNPWKNLDEKQEKEVFQRRPKKQCPSIGSRVSCQSTLIGHQEVLTDVKNLYAKCDSVYSRDMHHNVKRIFKSQAYNNPTKELENIKKDLGKGLTICLTCSRGGRPVIDHHYKPLSKVVVLKNAITYPDDWLDSDSSKEEVSS